MFTATFISLVTCVSPTLTSAITLSTVYRLQLSVYLFALDFTLATLLSRLSSNGSRTSKLSPGCSHLYQGDIILGYYWTSTYPAVLVPDWQIHSIPPSFHCHPTTIGAEAKVRSQSPPTRPLAAQIGVTAR